MIKELVALADVDRMRILLAMEREARSVQDIAALCGMTNDLVGEHLCVLGDAGLIASVRTGNVLAYRLRPERLNEIRAAAEFKSANELGDNSKAPASPILGRYFNGDRLVI